MDSPSSSPPPQVAQLIPRPVIIQQQQQQHKSTESQMQPAIETTKNTPEQSSTGQPKTTYTSALEKRIALLQSQINLLKSTKPQCGSHVFELEHENMMLKLDNTRLKSYIRELIEQAIAKDEEIATQGLIVGMEKEVDKKGKKVVDIDKRSRKRKFRSFVCFVGEGTDEVIDVMHSSSESSDDNNSDRDDELECDEDEDFETAIKRSRLEGIGSSSKMGSGSMEAGDTIQSMSGPSNGEVENFGVLDKIKPSIKEPLKLEIDLVPKCLDNGKELNDSNNHDASKLVGSSESGSSSCQMKSTADASEIVKLNENEAKLTHRKREWDMYWGSEEDMLCSLTSNPEMLLEAVCALYRMERKMRLSSPKGMNHKDRLFISESDYEKYVNVLQFSFFYSKCI
jgi:regulator of replication initiation timing